MQKCCPFYHSIQGYYPAFQTFKIAIYINKIRHINRRTNEKWTCTFDTRYVSASRKQISSKMSGCVSIILLCIVFASFKWSLQLPPQTNEISRVRTHKFDRKKFWLAAEINIFSIYFQSVRGDAGLSGGQSLESDYLDDNTTVDFDVTFERVLNTCKIKERIDQNEIEAVFDNVLPTTQTERCFIACWLEQFHVVSEWRREAYCLSNELVLFRWKTESFAGSSTSNWPIISKMTTSEERKCSEIFSRIVRQSIAANQRGTQHVNVWFNQSINSFLFYMFQMRTGLSHNEMYTRWCKEAPYWSIWFVKT